MILSQVMGQQRLCFEMIVFDIGVLLFPRHSADVELPLVALGSEVSQYDG